nr:hypothetical protein [Nonomuraea ceibae]
MLELAISAWAERIKQDLAQRFVIVRVEVAAFRREPAAAVTLRPGNEEVIDSRANDVAALRAQGDAELVGQRGLASAGRSVGGDPQRVRGRSCPDLLDKLAEEILTVPCSMFLLYYSNRGLTSTKALSCGSP